MPGEMRLKPKELDDLITEIEAGGGDASELKKLRADIPQPPPRSSKHRQMLEEEPTTEERLEAEAGYLFPSGVSGVLDTLMEYDRRYSLNELRQMCRDAGVSASGHKKLLAARLVAQGGKINMQQQWVATGDGALEMPKEYIEDLRFELIIFLAKKQFAVRCASYSQEESGAWLLKGVIIDTSKKNVQGKIELKRITYHPWVELVNVGFMVLPASEKEG